MYSVGFTAIKLTIPYYPIMFSTGAWDFGTSCTATLEPIARLALESLLVFGPEAEASPGI